MASTVTSIKLDTDLKSRVAALAEARQRKPHWIMIEAIREYVEREEKRQSCWNEAMASWQAFQQTGLHATRDEMESCFDQLEAGNNVEPPACHKKFIPRRHRRIFNVVTVSFLRRTFGQRLKPSEPFVTRFIRWNNTRRRDGP